MTKGRWSSHAITFNEVLERTHAVEKEFGVRIRFSVIPVSGPGGKSTRAITCTPYHTNGRKMSEVSGEQHLWPTPAYKSREALEMYLLVRLEQALSDHEQHQATYAEEAHQGGLTPLEQYISGQYPS